MQHDHTPMRLGSMLKKINALPHPQRRFPIKNGNRQLGLCQGGSDVSRHVIRTFHRVPVSGIFFRGNSLKEVAQIAHDIRIRVLLNQQ